MTESDSGSAAPPTVPRVKLTKQGHVDQLLIAGDYCIASDGRVVMACPQCATVFVCPHEVESIEPLTLSPSVVGPMQGIDQVLGSCGHHFWVKDGYAEEVR